MYAHVHTLARTQGACPLVPSTEAQLRLSLQLQTKWEYVGGRWIEGVKSDGVWGGDLSSGGKDKGGEKSAAHMLPFMVLVCSVNPGFCCFP